MKGFTPGLTLKQRRKAIWKWDIVAHAIQSRINKKRASLHNTLAYSNYFYSGIDPQGKGKPGIYTSSLYLDYTRPDLFVKVPAGS